MTQHDDPATALVASTATLTVTTSNLDLEKDLYTRRDFFRDLTKVSRQVPTDDDSDD